jgi:hypothetical protein
MRPGHVGVSEYDPNVLAGFQQGDRLVCATSGERIETCFFQKGYCSNTQQKLVFDDAHQRHRHESTENWRTEGFVQFLGLRLRMLGSFARWGVQF